MTILAAFLASMLFGIIFDVPGRSLIPAAIAGTLSWTCFSFLQDINLSPVGAAFIATIATGVYAEMMARIGRNPVSVFIVPGIIPLVPGAGAYFSMLHFVKGEFNQGLAVGIETILIAAAIAAGVAVISLVFRFMGLRVTLKH